jgi:hypothetical protein
MKSERKQPWIGRPPEGRREGLASRLAQGALVIAAWSVPAWAAAQEAAAKNYSLQWALVTLMTGLFFLIFCKSASREDKMKKVAKNPKKAS